jgi:O-antigen biosynthesis protein
MDIDSPWKLLSGAQLQFSEEYHEKPRVEIKPLLPSVANQSLDIGCGTGITSMMLKEIFPNLHTLGIEVQPQAAVRARTRLTNVTDHDLQKAPLPEAFAAAESIDLVLLLDVLEHMYHPWRALQHLKQSLSKNATVVASIPNARCLAFLDQIASGSFQYAPYGLFDVTHIRFFTLKNIRAMFTDCGYEIIDTMPIEYPPAMMPPIVSRSWQHVETKNFLFKHDAIDGFNELFAGQWLVAARPSA